MSPLASVVFPTHRWAGTGHRWPLLRLAGERRLPNRVRHAGRSAPRLRVGWRRDQRGWTAEMHQARPPASVL